LISVVRTISSIRKFTIILISYVCDNKVKFNHGRVFAKGKGYDSCNMIDLMSILFLDDATMCLYAVMLVLQRSLQSPLQSE
jgi:hypothetical protein